MNQNVIIVDRGNWFSRTFSVCSQLASISSLTNQSSQLHQNTNIWMFHPFKMVRTVSMSTHLRKWRQSLILKWFECLCRFNAFNNFISSKKFLKLQLRCLFVCLLWKLHGVRELHGCVLKRGITRVSSLVLLRIPDWILQKFEHCQSTKCSSLPLRVFCLGSRPQGVFQENYSKQILRINFRLELRERELMLRSSLSRSSSSSR